MFPKQGRRFSVTNLSLTHFHVRIKLDIKLKKNVIIETPMPIKIRRNQFSSKSPAVGVRLK